MALHPRRRAERYLECNGFRPADIHTLLLAGKMQTSQPQAATNGDTPVIDGRHGCIDPHLADGERLVESSQTYAAHHSGDDSP